MLCFIYNIQNKIHINIVANQTYNSMESTEHFFGKQDLNMDEYI